MQSHSQPITTEFIRAAKTQYLTLMATIMMISLQITFTAKSRHVKRRIFCSRREMQLVFLTGTGKLSSELLS